MKKLICLALVVLICMSLAAPVYASEDIFVPSITYKEAPTVGDASFGGNLPQEQPNDTPEVEDDYTLPAYDGVGGCVVVTSIIQAKEKTTDIYEEDRQQLLNLYEDLSKGSMNVDMGTEEPAEPEQEVNGLRKMARSIFQWFQPEEQREDSVESQNNGIQVHNDGSMQLTFNSENYVIRELVDVSFHKSSCVEPEHHHQETLEQEDVYIQVDFDLGIAADEEIVVLCYQEGTWEPVEETVNNGDGTVTCTFERFGPVAFCMETEEIPEEADQPDNIWLWVIVMLAALILLVVLVTRRKKAEEKEPADKEV